MTTFIIGNDQDTVGPFALMQILVEDFAQHVILGEFVLHLLSFHVVILGFHVTVDVLLTSVQSLLPVACVLLRPVTILVDDIQSIAPLA